MKRIIILSLALIILLGIMSNGTSSYFSDPENLSVTICSWQTVCEDTCGDHLIILTDYSFDGTNSTWTYEVTSGSSPSLSHWVLGWECDCSLIVDVYQLDENGDPINTAWECGTDPTTGVTGIKIDNDYYDGETRTVVFVLAGDYPLGQVTIGMKAGQDKLVCEACGPVCELPCPYDFLILVSGVNNTKVTEAYTVYKAKCSPFGTYTYTTTYPGTNYAVLAQHPMATDRDWDGRLTYEGNPYTFPDGAQWIWETWRTDSPATSASWWQPWPSWPSWWPSWFNDRNYRTWTSVTGRVATFERTFIIDCSPRDATLYITADNGYQVWINKDTEKEYLVGTYQLSGDWETNILYHNYLDTDGWQTVEKLTIPAEKLFAGENTLTIIAANEHMNQGDPDYQAIGDWDRNPAGLIYWLKVEWGD